MITKKRAARLLGSPGNILKRMLCKDAKSILTSTGVISGYYRGLPRLVKPLIQIRGLELLLDRARSSFEKQVKMRWFELTKIQNKTRCNKALTVIIPLELF